MRLFPACLLFGTVLISTMAMAKEVPLGPEQEKDGMTLGAVYLQPIEMEPEGMMAPAKDSDVHLEIDIKAAKGNTNGYAQGDWIPYLKVNYVLTKVDGGQTKKGALMPMVANDGPHYGDNAKMFGPGKYKMSISIDPPGMDFGRHVDKETGVGPWFKPITSEWEFTYAGTGKKGAY
ncbi:iron transporter [Beijerinckia sp. L45]|uniref:iron transporter n=1 Tax=Beijerinckia sp. L45 TaxID=1641855 RepID=UPI00131CC348|nr:iron transporter [Beijerinckia sp. L45]